MILYLASGSPRRAELLQQIAVPFTVLPPPSIDETPRAAEVPVSYVRRMAREKALVGRECMPVPGAVLGADTAVVMEGRILGKPADDAEALAILTQLSGQSHQVVSAVCVCLEDRHAVRHTVTTVQFRALESARLEAYVATGEGRDKAGSYGIQGLGGALVESLSGSYSAVVGLPLEQTVALLEWADIPYWQID